MLFSKPSLFLFITLFFFGCQTQRVRPYDYTPVLLHLSVKKQPKHIGFNLPKEIPVLLYDHILNGTVTLWKDHNKSEKISIAAFQKLEQQSLTDFKLIQDVFFYEHWSINKKLFTSKISGISFLGVDKNGDKLNFGYVSMEDVYNLFVRNIIPNNANGNFNVSYWQAIQSRVFNYNLVQFGKNDFKSNPKKSVELVYQAEYHPNIKRKKIIIPEQKRVEFHIIKPQVTSNSENGNVYMALKNGLESNMHIFFNKIGVKDFNQTINLPIEIKSVKIVEYWTKKDAYPYQEIDHLILIANEYEIELSMEELLSMGLKINQVNFDEFLGYKSFDFIITKINHQEIKPVNSSYYYEALQNKKWNQLD